MSLLTLLMVIVHAPIDNQISITNKSVCPVGVRCPLPLNVQQFTSIIPSIAYPPANTISCGYFQTETQYLVVPPRYTGKIRTSDNRYPSLHPTRPQDSVYGDWSNPDDTYIISENSALYAVLCDSRLGYILSTPELNGSV